MNHSSKAPLAAEDCGKKSSSEEALAAGSSQESPIRCGSNVSAEAHLLCLYMCRRMHEREREEDKTPLPTELTDPAPVSHTTHTQPRWLVGCSSIHIPTQHKSLEESIQAELYTVPPLTPGQSLIVRCDTGGAISGFSCISAMSQP